MLWLAFKVLLHDGDAEMEKLRVIICTLNTWNSHKISVVGHASTRGSGNLRWARNRAHMIAQLLKNAGIDTEERGEYPVANQRSMERQLGFDAFRNVEITLQRETTAPPRNIPDNGCSGGSRYRIRLVRSHRQRGWLGCYFVWRIL
jgi:hypothetical protein